MHTLKPPQNFYWNSLNIITLHAHTTFYTYLSSYIPIITFFLSQFIAIKTIESSSSIHRTSKVTKTTKTRKIEQLALHMKYIQIVKTISLTTNFKTKISSVKMKIYVSRTSCQNFSLIRRLTKRESSFYQ